MQLAAMRFVLGMIATQCRPAAVLINRRLIITCSRSLGSPITSERFVFNLITLTITYLNNLMANKL